jgi:uncharacterized protein
MKIFVKVKIKRSLKGSAVEQVDATHLVVTVSALRKEGKANEAVLKALAKHFDVSPSRVVLTRGATSKEKVFEISAFSFVRAVIYN